MSDLAARTPSLFFLWVSVACAALIFGGFVPTYWAPLATTSLGEMAPVVHLHGIIFFSWALFLLLQTWLIGQRRVAAHRSVGLVGISLATAMVILGFIVSLRANVERMEAGQVARAYDLGFSNSFALVAFAVLVALAIVKRAQPAAHKRLMLFATLMILTPAVGRLYRPVFAPSPPSPLIVFGTIDAILVACAWHDLKAFKRLHPVTLGAGLTLLAFQILRFPIPRMAWWQATYDWLLRLAS
jgi:uncharacterized membrane protein YozB (DUF420 family)